MRCLYALAAGLLLTALPGCSPSGGKSPSGEPLVSTWLKIYGGDPVSTMPNAVATMEDGTVVMTGSLAHEDGQQKMWVASLRADGEVNWSNTYGNPGGGLPLGLFYSMAETDGGVIVLGRDMSDFPAVVRVDLDGNLLWQQSYASYDRRSTVIRRGTGDRYFLAGQDGRYVDGVNLGANLWLLEIDGADGAVLRERTLWRDIDGDNLDGDLVPRDILALPGNEALVVGSFGPSDPGLFFDVVETGYAARLTNDLALKNENSYGWYSTARSRYWFHSVRPHGTAGFIAAGWTNGWEMLVVRFDSDLEVVWEDLYELGDGAGGFTIVEAGDGGYLVGGYVDSPERLPFLAKYNAAGERLWEQPYSADDRDAICTISPLSSNWLDGYALGTTDQVIVVDMNGAPTSAFPRLTAGIDESYFCNDLDRNMFPVDGDQDGIRDDGFILLSKGELVRTDSAGNPVWTLPHMSSAPSGVGRDLAERPGAGVLVVGESAAQEGPTSDAWILGLNASGQIDWQVAYGTEFHDAAVAVTRQEDRFLVAGHGSVHPFVLALDDAGHELWQRRFEAPSQLGFIPHDIIAAADGRLYLAGADREVIRIVRLLPDGTPDAGWNPWMRVYIPGPWTENDSDYDVGHLQLAPLADGFMLMADMTHGGRTYVAGVDAAGEPLWARYVENWYSEPGRAAFAPTGDGGVVIAQMSRDSGSWLCGVHSFLDCPNLSILSLDAAGEPLWRRDYATAGRDYPRAITFAPDCGLLVAGQSDGYSYPKLDAWLLKTGGDGMISTACAAYRTPDQSVEVVEAFLERVPVFELEEAAELSPLTRVDSSGTTAAWEPTIARSCSGEAPPLSPCGPPDATPDDDLIGLQDVVSPDDAATEIIADAPYVKDTGECIGDPADFNGVWEVHFTCKNTCSMPPIQSGIDKATITQVGDFANIQEEMGFFVGHGPVCGNVFTWSGSGAGYTESGEWVKHKDGSITKTSHWESDDEPECNGDCTGDIYPWGEGP